MPFGHVIEIYVTHVISMQPFFFYSELFVCFTAFSSSTQYLYIIRRCVLFEMLVYKSYDLAVSEITGKRCVHGQGFSLHKLNGKGFVRPRISFLVQIRLSERVMFWDDLKYDYMYKIHNLAFYSFITILVRDPMLREQNLVLPVKQCHPTPLFLVLFLFCFVFVFFCFVLFWLVCSFLFFISSVFVFRPSIRHVILGNRHLTASRVHLTKIFCYSNHETTFCPCNKTSVLWDCDTCDLMWTIVNLIFFSLSNI